MNDTHAAAAAQFHEENPHVYRLLRRFALEARRAGRVRLGIKAVFERLRWYVAFETKDDHGLKLNNNYTAWYARELMQREPELRDFFVTRGAHDPDYYRQPLDVSQAEPMELF